MKKIFSKEFIIGICVIVALAILFFGIDYLKGINLFRPANFYYAYYDNVNDLEVAAPVKINGYKVGQVREINFPYDKPGKIEVLLALDKNLKIPEGSVAYIGSTLMSGAYINLHQGNSSKIMAVGSEIPTANTGDLMSALSESVVPQIEQILPKVDSLLANLNRLVADPALTASIQRLDGITGNVYLATQGLNTAMNSQLPGILNNAGHAAVNIDSITTDLTQLSAQLRDLPLRPTMQNIAEVSDNLAAFSRQLNDSKSTLGLLMNDPELYYKLDRVAADVDSLIVDIKKNPKRYISIKLL